MISLLGRGLVLAAVVVAAAGALAGVAGGLKRSAFARTWAFRLAYLFGALMLGANLLMEYALLAPDFSVHYAAQVASRSSPTWIALVSLWSALEGSILFWGLILGGFVVAFAWFARERDPVQSSLAVGLALAVGVFFGFLIAGPADPFRPVFPVPPDGPGPNPLLQNHVLMVIHPPMLYLGYVGMTIPFALAAAALLAGQLERGMLRLLRRWLMVAWTFLTVGIVLGGWWAYEVLGWGGYWAWDPVENASLLPWLTSTAALHSMLVVERRGALKGWTLTLVLGSFLLTILGTFMTRSGIFNSVHAFSQSDIGPTFLGFLALALVFSILLLSARIRLLEADGPLAGATSRDGAFLVNNLLFVTLTLTVLLGTVFPLIVEAINGTRISVGEPYFNRMAIPLGVAVLFLMAIGPALPWGRAASRQSARALGAAAFVGLAAAGIGWMLGAHSFWLVATVFAAGMALAITVREALAPALARARESGSALRALAVLGGAGRRRLGSYVIHLGVVGVMVAVGASTALRQSTEASLRRGESARVGPYAFTFVGTESQAEPNRLSTIARFAITRADDGSPVGEMGPRMNQYLMMREPVGSPDVLSMPSADLYLSVMSLDPDGNRVGLRAFLNPLVGWIWVGAGVMVLGAVLALVPAGRRRTASAGQSEPTATDGNAFSNAAASAAASGASGAGKPAAAARAALASGGGGGEVQGS